MSRHHQHVRGKRWARKRRLVLDAAGWRCQHCGRPGRLEVDHIKPLHLGGAPWDLANLQALCRACHITKTAAENRRPERPEEAAWRRLVDELADPAA